MHFQIIAVAFVEPPRRRNVGRLALLDAVSHDVVDLLFFFDRRHWLRTGTDGEGARTRPCQTYPDVVNEIAAWGRDSLVLSMRLHILTR
jgi:hypothetical protein